MTDPRFPQIPEGLYLSDYAEGERLRREQEFFGGFVRRQSDGPMQPQVEAEGSALNNPRIGRNK